MRETVIHKLLSCLRGECLSAQDRDGLKESNHRTLQFVSSLNIIEVCRYKTKQSLASTAWQWSLILKPYVCTDSHRHGDEVQKKSKLCTYTGCHFPFKEFSSKTFVGCFLKEVIHTCAAQHTHLARYTLKTACALLASNTLLLASEVLRKPQSTKMADVARLPVTTSGNKKLQLILVPQSMNR